MAELKKKYGLLTAICMVIGIVVGSGVFFKAEAILNHTLFLYEAANGVRYLFFCITKTTR